MAKAVRRNALRLVEGFKLTHTDVVVHDYANGFAAERVEGPEWAWKQWEQLRSARATVEDDGSLTIYLHGRRWYKLRQPA